MFRLFRSWLSTAAKRPSPRTVRHSHKRPPLALELLETRINPYTLTTGSLFTDGNATWRVDGYGAWGYNTYGNAADFNPMGFGGARNMGYDAAIAIGFNGGARTYLTSGSVYSGRAGYLSNAPVSGDSTTGTSTFTFGTLSFNLTQTVAPFSIGGTRVGASLTQTYNITNTSGSTQNFDLVSYLDGYVLGSYYGGGGYLSNGATRYLVLTDNASPPTTSQTFISVQAVGGTIPATNSYQVDYYYNHGGPIQTGAALTDSVRNDTNSDNFVDSFTDEYVASLRNVFSLGAGLSTTYTFTTIFATAAPITLIPGLNFTQTFGSTTVAEGSAVTDTYAVSLYNAPTANVVVSVTTDGQVSVSPTTLTFTPANFATGQTVTVSSVVDAVPEGPHIGIITHSTTSGDADYNGLSSPFNVNVTEPALTIGGGSINVVEGANTDVMSVSLNTTPSSNVLVTFTDSVPQVSLSTSILTFTPGNWNTPQTVTVSGIADGIPEGNHTGVISVAASGDPLYANALLSSITANISEPGANVSGGSLFMTEGLTDSYLIRLTAQPTGDVYVNLSPNAQVAVSSNVLTFTPLNYSIYQNVTVTAIADGTPEGSHTGIITQTVSGDPIYTGVILPTITANITEPSAYAYSTSLTAKEGGSSTSFYISLNNAPPTNVVLTFTPDSQVSVTPSTLTYTPSNYWWYQYVTVNAVLDAVAEGAHIGTITTTGDGIYNGVALPTINVSITEPGLNVNQTGGSTTVVEGTGSDLFSVRLDTAPPGNVVITITTDTQVNISTSLLTFTPANWNFPAQNVTVTAPQDGAPEGTHTGSITFTGDGIYANTSLNAATVVVNVNESGLNINQTGGSLDIRETPTSTDTFSVRLTNAPTSNVLITLVPDAQVNVNPSVLTFTPANWNFPAQNVTVNAIMEGTPEGIHTGTIGFSSSGDPLFVNVAFPTLTANITEPGLTIVQAGGTGVTEGANTDTYTVRLDTAPTSNVLVTLSTPDGQTSVTPSVLTFTSLSWSTPQLVTVTAIADGLTEGIHTGLITAASSGDAIYTNVQLATVTATVYEPGVYIEESAGTTVVTEGGLGPIERYRIQLTSQPAADVTVSITADPQLNLTVTSLTFTAVNWNAFQYVVVASIDDGVYTGTRMVPISHAVSSTDPIYSPITARTVTATINDNEPIPPTPTPGVTLVETGATAVSEGGVTDTYTLVLDSAPSVDVLVTLSPDTQLTVAPGVLTFTPINWNFPQTVSVTAVDDLITEPLTHYGVITPTLTSGDTGYNGFIAPPVTAVITDNDNPAVTINATGLAVAEGSTATSTYTLVLATQPTANVVVTIAPDSQVTVVPSILTFTPANWNVARTVAVSSIDDGYAELSPHAGVLSHTASSGDGNYNGLAVPNATANIIDNDVPGAAISPLGTNLTVLEGGGSDFYSVVLKTQPTADVIVNPTPGPDLSVTPAALTFSPSNWNVSQKFYVSSNSNSAAQGSHTDAVVNRTSSTDLAYNNLAIGTVGVNIIDLQGGTSISGTAGADQILASPSTNDPSQYQISVNGKITLVSNAIAELTLVGGNGNDTIQVINPPFPVAIEGGNGTDKVIIIGRASANTFDLGNFKLDVNGAKITYWLVESMLVSGKAGDDTFTVSVAPTFPIEFKGDAGNDTLIGAPANNNFAVTASNTGSVNSFLKFSAMENLTGGSADDTFVFSTGKGVTGKIDGGSGSNTLDFSAYTGPLTVNLQSNSVTGISGGFQNVTAIKAGKSTADKFIGPNQDLIWAISAINGGNTSGITFHNFENLTGGSGNDTFQFTDGQSIKGKIDGGTGNDILDFTTYTSKAVIVNLQAKTASGTGGILNLEQFWGNGNSAATIIGANLANNWNLNGLGSGTVGSIVFKSFANFTGGTLADAFNMDAGGDWLGTLSGGAGTDTLTAFSGTTNIYSGTGASGTLNGRKFILMENRK